MSAINKMQNRKMVDAYRLFIRGLMSNYYNPVLHTYSFDFLTKILGAMKMDPSVLKKFKFL